MSESYVIAIDVGIRNMGIAVYSCVTKELVDWKRVDICKGEKYHPHKNVHYIKKLIDEHANYFANCKMLLVERQMRVNMRIIESVFQTLFYDNCLVVQAQLVKMHFSISCRDYKQNKKRAVEYLTCIWEDIKTEIPNLDTWALSWNASKKSDDLADSLLMLLYFLHTYDTSV
jgi:hypothetical protein